jgi:hypothetical protein
LYSFGFRFLLDNAAGVRKAKTSPQISLQDYESKREKENREKPEIYPLKA